MKVEVFNGNIPAPVGAHVTTLFPLMISSPACNCQSSSGKLKYCCISKCSFTLLFVAEYSLDDEDDVLIVLGRTEKADVVVSHNAIRAVTMKNLKFKCIVM